MRSSQRLDSVAVASGRCELGATFAEASAFARSYGGQNGGQDGGPGGSAGR
jgi:hypothetical protein